MREDRHSQNTGLVQMQKSAKHEYVNCLTAADLSWRCWQDIEHVVDGVTKDCRAKGDVQIDSPEC